MPSNTARSERFASPPRPNSAGAFWTVSVADQGPGISPDHVYKIFEAFQRGEMHGQDGVGLGLAIASRAAKLLEAKLTVESAVGRGTAFRLQLAPGSLNSGPPLKTS